MPKLNYTEPPKQLLIELEEVAQNALFLSTELTKANLLPDGFPVEQLQEMLSGLQLLPFGTAEGCRQPLEYARSRLPSIRRDFIETEEESGQRLSDEDIPPPLTRGMTIDVKIGALVYSVSSALDTYRALASTLDDTATDTSPSQHINTESSNYVAALEASKLAENNLDERIDELVSIANPGSQPADDLKRQMRDTQGLLRLARIEMRMPSFVPVWFKKTIETLTNYPKLMRITLETIKIGVDIARPLANGWSHFQHGFKNLALDTVEKAADDYLGLSKKWEIERDQRLGKSSEDSTKAPPDFDLEKIHEMIVRGEAPKPSWQPWVTLLNFKDHNDLQNIEPISGLMNLVSLDIGETGVKDISPLSGLTKLGILSLNSTGVKDISPLSGLTKLGTLDIEETGVKDISPLSGLTNLVSLDIAGTSVIDISPLSRLTKLRILSLNSTGAKDISPLSGLTNLVSLDIARTGVKDISPLSRLTKLVTLDVDETEISEISALSNLTMLETLNLNDTKVTSIMSLSSLKRMKDLDLDNLEITDISPVSSMTKLWWLSLDGTRTTDISPLSGLTNLKMLYLAKTDVADVSKLARLKKLALLNLSHTKVTDISSLSGLIHLESLYLENTRVTDTSSLDTLPKLKIFGNDQG